MSKVKHRQNNKLKLKLKLFLFFIDVYNPLLFSHYPATTLFYVDNIGEIHILTSTAEQGGQVPPPQISSQ